MIIDQLPTISNVQNSDELPIERGQTTYKTTVGKVVDAVSKIVADEYDNTSTYAVGDYCVYEGTLYVCNTAISTAEEWTATHWTATNVTDEIPSAYNSNPEMDGTASPGSSGSWAAGDHVHPHDSLIVRANLLDNWYFVGGGTGAYGTFPVNQRGQASYSTNEAYTIDRWKLRVEMGGSCAVGANGVTITGNSGGSTVISQTFLNGGKALSGKKVTFSVWVTEKTGGVKMFACNASGPVYFGTQLASKGVEVGLNTLTVDIPATLSNPYLNFMVGDTSSAISFTLAAAKLEIGDTQTLAHQESGAWVLNEMPDYGEQLQKCMAYFAKVQAATGTWDMILPAFAISATRCRAVVPLSVPLRGFPIVTDYGAFQVTPTADINNGFSVTDISIQVQTIVGLVINIDVASGLTAGENYFLRNNNSTSAYFTISAEP